MNILRSEHCTSLPKTEPYQCRMLAHVCEANATLHTPSCEMRESGIYGIKWAFGSSKDKHQHRASWGQEVVKEIEGEGGRVVRPCP